MTWPEARTALRTVMEGVAGDDIPVYYTPPPHLPRRGMSIVMPIPGRDVDRRPSDIRRTLYEQTIDVYHWAPSNMSPAQAVTVADLMDDMVEAIDDALDASLQLSGAAVSVSAPVWDEATGVEYADVKYVLMECTLDIEIEKVNAGFDS